MGDIQYPIASCSSDVLEARRNSQCFNLIIGYAATQKGAISLVSQMLPDYMKKGMALHVHLVRPESDVNHCGESFWQYFLCEKGALCG